MAELISRTLLLQQYSTNFAKPKRLRRACACAKYKGNDSNTPNITTLIISPTKNLEETHGDALGLSLLQNKTYKNMNISWEGYRCAKFHNCKLLRPNPQVPRSMVFQGCPSKVDLQSTKKAIAGLLQHISKHCSLLLLHLVSALCLKEKRSLRAFLEHTSKPKVC